MNHSGNTKGNRLPAEVLTRQEVQSLLAACSRNAPTGIRNKALIALLYRAGLRVSEALKLKPEDYTGDSLSILWAKGGKQRKVGLDEDTTAFLDRWVDCRKNLKIRRKAPLFCTLQGGAIKTAYLRSLFPRLAHKAGILKRVHAHGLRHTCASEMREESIDIGVISKQLGHSSISVTARYLDHINPKAVIDAGRARGNWN